MSALEIGSHLQMSDGDVARSLVEALWEAPVAMAVFDRDLRVVGVNPAMEELNGVSWAGHRGRGLPEVLPGLAPEAQGFLEQVLATGKPIINAAYSGETAAVPGERRYWQGSCFPARDRGGAIVGLCVLVTEISALKRQEEETRRARAEAERAARRLDQLHHLSAALSKALTAQRVAKVVLEVGMPLLGASAGTVVASGPGAESHRALAMLGFGQEALELLARAAELRPAPHIDAGHSGNPVWLESKEASRKLYPAFAEIYERLEFEAAAVAPLIVDGQPIGFLTFAYREARHFDPDDRAFILALAVQTAQALERARLFEAEQRARARAERVATLLDTFIAAAPCGLAFLDEGLRFVKVNAAMAALNGVSTEAHLGRPLSEVIAYPELERAFRYVAETHEPLESLAMTTRDQGSGEPRQWLASLFPVCDSEGALVGVGSALTEVTAIRRAERERDESGQLLEEMIAAAPQGLAMLDPQLRFLRVNSAFAAITGLPVSDHLGRAAAELFPAEHAAQLEAQWRRTLEEGTPIVDLELRSHARGREWDCVASWFPMRSSGGCAGLGLVVHDISVQRQAREFQRNLLGIVGHDLRNPLTAITASASLLLRGESLGQHDRRQLERILKGSRRIERIIADLLEFTQLRAGCGMPISLRPALLSEICAGVIDEFEAGHPTRTIEWSGEGDGRGEWDSGRIGQLVSNLLSNALKFGAAQSPVQLRWHGESAEVVIEVENHGPPVPPEARDRIFVPFLRCEDQPPENAERGLGLGLFIARQIAAAHGGTLELSSPPASEQTVFTVRLPRRPAAEECASP